jgi:hypothetical protein
MQSAVDSELSKTADELNKSVQNPSGEQPAPAAKPDQPKDQKPA